jgi:hypothetical protein
MRGSFENISRQRKRQSAIDFKVVTLSMKDLNMANVKQEGMRGSQMGTAPSLNH